jgi:hypothetical protein
MQTLLLQLARVASALILLCSFSAIPAQQPEHPAAANTDQPENTIFVSGIARIAGVDAASHIQYVRLLPQMQLLCCLRQC